MSLGLTITRFLTITAMKIDSTNHTIVCEKWETPMVTNYLMFCTNPKEKWKITFVHQGVPDDEILYRNAKP